ncbi:NAD(P)-dependent oxidoreductase [Cryptosporangium sp. NPDC051539]|uniref:NAD(P)-dependent oxidoreductase n=1 Tax=Cryptosporangium sp. NPDC051539 TaxID=3363962 RepID=UPI0037B08DA8
MSEIRTVGFVGLGNMGLPMVTRLVSAGFAVRAYDRSGSAVARAEEAGATGVESAAAAADGAEAVVLMLPDSAVVSAVVRLLADALQPGALVVDCSSSEPLVTRALAEELASHGVRMIDAPVSGGVKGAEKGSLTVMVGGADEDVAAATPVLTVFGRVVHAGPVGSGDAVKALNNLLSATHLLVTSEAILAGQRFGLKPEVMLSVFNGSSGRSGSTENKWPNFILPGTYDSGFGLRLMLKDMRIAVGLAEQTGRPARLGADAVALWAEAADALEASADHTEIARWLGEDS